MMKYAKAVVALLIVIIAGIYFVPDPASLKTALFAVSTVMMIATTIVLVIGTKKHWGVLPGLDLHETVLRATRTPLSSAVLLSGFLIFLGLLIIAIFKAA